jgi:hypothetical protein
MSPHHRMSSCHRLLIGLSLDLNKATIKFQKGIAIVIITHIMESSVDVVH